MFFKTLPFLILLFFQAETFADCPTLAEIRTQYLQALRNKNAQKTLFGLRQQCLKCHYQDSTYTGILESMAVNFSEQKMYDDAIVTIEEAIKINKTHQKNVNEGYLGSNYYKLGSYLDEIGKTKEALEKYDLGISIALKNPLAKKYLFRFYANKATVFVKNGDYEKAIIQDRKSVV